MPSRSRRYKPFRLWQELIDNEYHLLSNDPEIPHLCCLPFDLQYSHVNFFLGYNHKSWYPIKEWLRTMNKPEEVKTGYSRYLLKRGITRQEHAEEIRRRYGYAVAPEKRPGS